MNPPSPGAINADIDVDEDLEVWDQFVTAVRWLRASRARPGLTLASATQEALSEWLAEQASLYSGDKPFQDHP